ncbi:MAG: hypothetical protein FWC99_05670 [Coriobacteriia bacterium]|nr:hypothetical protein [Coriobacteriia bacterium]
MKSTDDLMNLLKSKDSYKDVTEATSDFLDVTLVEYLIQLIAEKELKKSEIIARSGIERTYAYQIPRGEKVPSRDKLLALSFGMKLTLEEVQALLKTNGYAQLYAKNRRDSVIIFALNKGQDIIELNESLFSVDEPLVT